MEITEENRKKISEIDINKLKFNTENVIESKCMKYARFRNFLLWLGIKFIKEKKETVFTAEAIKDLGLGYAIITRYFDELCTQKYLEKNKTGSANFYTPVSEEKIKELYEIAYKYYKEKKDDSNEQQR